MNKFIVRKQEMSEKQLILALEASLCALEGVRHLEGMSQLRDSVEKYIEAEYKDKPMSAFLADQKKSVDLLAKNPQVFGYHPDFN